MGFDLATCSPELKARIQEAIEREDRERKNRVRNRPAVSDANLEPDTGNAQVQSKEAPRLDPQRRYRVRVTGYRHRLTDPDGQSIKALIDGFVHSNILINDTVRQISGIEVRQVEIDE
jgi:hypothetical protein